MPIVNYKHIADRNEARLLRSTKISKENKETLQHFLRCYDVSDARRAIFLERIVPLLEEFPRVRDALDDSVGMEGFFQRLRERYAPATYATYLNVCRCFLRSLNDGEKPRCLRRIRTPKISQTRRQLNPEELITWDEVFRMAALAPSFQLKALVTVQMDGGFRPSEIHDLNLGDIGEVDGVLVATVRNGKTGGRQVVLHRSSEFLQDWLQNHPGQSPKDPLWISESRASEVVPKIVRYNYPAMRKRFRTLAKRAGIDSRKATDFYSLRHASCAADKRDNLPIDIGAARHGHSVKHFTETYGALNLETTVMRIRQHYRTSAASAEPVSGSSASTGLGAGNTVGREFLRLVVDELRGGTLNGAASQHTPK